MFTGQRMTPRPGEPAWTEEDIEYALGYQEYQRSLCPGCGQPRSESHDRANDGGYEVDVSTCHACAAMASSARARSDAAKDTRAATEGLYMGVHLIRE